MKTSCAFCLVALLILLGLGLAGCGEVRPRSITIATQPTPSPTPPIPGFPTPTPSPTPIVTPTPIPTPTPTPSPTPLPVSTIAGRVLDAQTGLAIGGAVVVALERPAGDFSILMQTVADATGAFQFDNVPLNVPADNTGNGYAIMVSAQAADGTMFTPALLTSGGGDLGSGDAILPGTSVGTIFLQRNSTATVNGTVSSATAASTPVSVRAHLGAPLTLSTVHRFPVPFAQQPADLVTNPAITACSGGSGACAAFSVVLPAAPLQVATFNRLGFVFVPSSQPANYQMVFQAFSLISGQPDCVPSVAVGSSFILTAGQTLPLANQPFVGCQ
jgi:hypothetical protein